MKDKTLWLLILVLTLASVALGVADLVTLDGAEKLWALGPGALVVYGVLTLCEHYRFCWYGDLD